MNRMWNWLGAALLLALLPTAGLAQEYVSVADVYEQAQAMEGVWQETFDTPNGPMTVDVPIIVPDVETMPVITVEKAKISEELFDRIVSGKKYGLSEEISYETEIDGELIGFYLGRENDDSFGIESGLTGYDAFSLLFIKHGDFLSSRDDGKWKGTMPREGYYPWELDFDAVCVRDRDITVNEAMRLWQEDLALGYPDEEFTIRPTNIVLRGSTLNTDSQSKDKRKGLIVIEGAEQLIGGIPLMGTISKGCGIARHNPDSVSERMEVDRLYTEMIPYRIGSDSVLGGGGGFYGTFMDENTYRTSSMLARVRTVEYADVPLAPLDSVLESVREKVESGNIIRLNSIKLGYLLYSNPEMTDYAWAIPRWIVTVMYLTDENRDEYFLEKAFEPDEEMVKWENYYQASVPMDAQTGELIIFTGGDAETFRVPDMVTWDEVR